MAAYKNDQQVETDYQTPGQAFASVTAAGNSLAASNAADMKAINDALASIGLAPASAVPNPAAEEAGKVANATAVAAKIGGTVSGDQVVAPGAGGSKSTTPPPPPATPTAKTVTGSYTDANGNVFEIWSDGSTTQVNTGVSQNALQLVQATLAGYGIDTTGAIGNAIYGLVAKNYDASTIQALIEDPASAKSSDPAIAALANAWDTRFSGNVAREAAGLTPLAPADYIATENAYKAVLTRAGISATNPMLQPQFMGQLIGQDVSAAEVNQRVTAATTAVTSEDPFVTQQLQQNFGLTQEDMVHALLDPNTASDVIATKVQASQIQGEAARQNLALNQQNAISLAAQGVTQAQANTAFTNVGTQLGAQQQLANIYGMNAAGIGNALTAQQTGANLNGISAAQANIQLAQLRAQEVSQFSGSSGASKGSLYTENEGVS